MQQAIGLVVDRLLLPVRLHTVFQHAELEGRHAIERSDLFAIELPRLEELLVGGVCQTGEKCEAQDDGLFLMPLYPWGAATLREGAFTVMVAQIRETLVQATPPPASVMRRLLHWMGSK